MLYIAAAIAAVMLIYVIFAYNKGIGLRNYMREAFATMDVCLKKRWELIPRLADSVKGAAKYESSTMQNVARIRAQSYSGMSDEQKIQANSEIGYMGPKFMAIAENYPDLKANASFLKLMDGLTDIENEIASARKYYNGTVRELNTFLELFPTNIIGRLFRIDKADYFQIDESEREAKTITNEDLKA
ncbi:MAG: LemA family protein [Elusimicrobiales bacterium]|nr:LemA family protein [Elusimicrobiales bacterium]